MRHLSHAYFNPNQITKTGETGLFLTQSQKPQKDAASLLWGGGLIIIISYIVTIAGTIVFLKLVYCFIKQKCLKLKHGDKKCEC